MLGHDVLTASLAPRLRQPSCPQCGETLLAPLMAEHVNAAHVRNHWVCEACGHAFRKSTKFAIATGQAA